MSNSTERSDVSQSRQSWYSCRRWRDIRRSHLRNSPWCVECLKDGKKIVATIADHVERHNYDEYKFFNGKLQSLCKPHHDSFKQAFEKRGYSGEADSSGWPTDPNHPANRKT